jgi:hypothetical protein
MLESKNPEQAPDKKDGQLVRHSGSDNPDQSRFMARWGKYDMRSLKCFLRCATPLREATPRTLDGDTKLAAPRLARSGTPQ